MLLIAESCLLCLTGTVIVFPCPPAPLQSEEEEADPYQLPIRYEVLLGSSHIKAVSCLDIDHSGSRLITGVHGRLAWVSVCICATWPNGSTFWLLEPPLTLAQPPQAQPFAACALAPRAPCAWPLSHQRRVVLPAGEYLDLLQCHLPNRWDS